MNADTTSQAIKLGPMQMVKEDKALKSQWSAARREITPKIGQLTNDASSITTVVSLTCLNLASF